MAEISSENPQLAEKLHRLIKKIKKLTVYSCFKGNIWSADLADMQLTSKHNKGIQFLFYEIFQIILGESEGHEANKCGEIKVVNF